MFLPRNRGERAAADRLGTLAADPNVVHPEVLLAELLSAAGFPGDARGVLEELSAQDPSRQDLYLAFCEMAVREKRWFDGWNLAAMGERAAPGKHWSKEFAQQVADRLRLLKAVCCEGRRDWKAAQEIYSALRQTEKNSRDVLVGLGRTSFHLGDAQAAIEHFTSLRQVNPAAEPPYLLLAQLYDSTGQAKAAEAAYRQAVKSADGAEQGQSRLSFARWLVFNNRPQDAVQVLAEPIRDSEENETERQFLQALAARLEGRLLDAQKILSGLHQQNASNFVISNQLALVLVQNPDEAMRARALQIASANSRNFARSSEAWATLGWIQFRLGDRSAAEQSLATASQLGPFSRDTLHYLRELKQSVGDKQAVELLDKACAEAKGPDYFAPDKKARPDGG